MPAQDFKRARDGDEGPNTGGMGAYAPLPWAPADLTGLTMDTVIQPAVDVMRRRGTPYAGLLYAGLSLTPAGLRVVEFNARFGDPETQVILDRLASPLAPLLAAAAAGDLASVPPPRWRPGAAVTVVLAAEGYPGNPVKGDKIKISYSERAEVSPARDTGSPRPGAPAAPQAPEAYILHAGTALDADGDLVSAGGRVLDVVGSGPDLAAARSAAYELAGMIELRGGWYRHDIAERASK
jgi:phosphoribosylamine--glycine ligase